MTDATDFPAMTTANQASDHEHESELRVADLIGRCARLMVELEMAQREVRERTRDAMVRVIASVSAVGD